MSSKPMNNNNSRTDLSDIPPHVLDIIRQYIVGVHHDEDYDMRRAHLRQSIKDYFPFIVFMYALLVILGILANLSVLVHVLRHKLYKDATYAFVINNVLSDIMKCVITLPMTLLVLLVQNWILGELLCSFLPMLQDIPVHVTTLTFVLMAWDRYRMIRNPSKPRMPAFVCAVGTWLTSLCLVLPFPIYIIYVDLGKFAPSLDGVGFCVVNLIDDMQEYMRGIFLIMYAGPMATISYLYVKSSRELQTNLTVIMFETRHRSSRSRNDSHSTTTEMRGSRGECDILSQYSRGSFRDSGGSSRIRQEPVEPELDVIREKRTNKYLVAMVTVYAVCLCPLMILRVARLVLQETYENTGHFDLTYTMFVWIGFLPICTTPLLYAAWQMSRSSKERLRGYFRFSNRKLRQSCENVVQTAQHSAHGSPMTEQSRRTCRSSVVEQPLAHFGQQHKSHQLKSEHRHSDLS